MWSAVPTSRRVPFQVADCFVLAWDAFMRRTRQGGHVSQSVIETDRLPELSAVRRALDRATEKFPLLTAAPRRCWRTRQPFWELRAAPPLAGLPLGLWRESDVPDSELPGSQVVAGLRALTQHIAAGPMRQEAIPYHARVDIVALSDSRFAVVLTWSHLLFDGKGAELLFKELGQLCAGADVPFQPAAAYLETSPAPFLQRLRLTKPAMDHQTTLQRTGVPSLAGPHLVAGKPDYEVVTLTPEETARVRGRAERMVGALFPLTFFVACVARAHDRVFAARGRHPAGYGISVPSQTRKRGQGAPLFHNHVAALLFHPRREHLGSIEETAAAMKGQFAEMVRNKVAESFNAVLSLMMPLPSRLFFAIVRMQFKGEICTCFHSYTGQFAPDLTHFAGAVVLNGYHLPCLGSPPGTGIFFSDRGDRLNVTLSWREGVLTEAERTLMMAQLRADLLGPELTCCHSAES